MTLAQACMVLIGGAFAAATGTLAVQTVEQQRRRPDLLTLCFGLSMGAAIHSVGYLLWTTLLPSVAGGWAAIDTAILLLAIIGWRRYTAAAPPLTPRHREPGGLHLAAVTVAALSLYLAASALWWNVAREPLGRWDAWSIWNFKARMLFLVPDHLQMVFGRPFPHPDYPLMLPLTVARLWRYAGTDVLGVPQWIAILTTLATVLTLIAGVTRLRGLTTGCIGGIVLLSSLFFIRHGATQLADTLVSLHMMMAALAAAIWIEDESLPADASFPILIGALAGCAAWTKNEGMSFAVYLLLATGFAAAIRYRRTAWAPLMRLAAGASPFVALIATQRLLLAERGTDLFVRLNAADLFARIGDADRHIHIFRGIRAVLASTIDWPVIVLMLLAGGIARWQWRGGSYGGVTIVASVFALQFATCIAVYLMTPHDVSWHLLTSADRVLIQLWPTFVLALCLLLPLRTRCHEKCPADESAGH